jgi:hypothetical protein
VIHSECLVCKKIYDFKENGHKDISYSHGYCSEACIEVSKKLSKKEKEEEK